MNTLNTFNTQRKKTSVFNGRKLVNEDLRESQAQGATQWRRVFDVILVEGEMRYLVERGE